MSGALVMQMDDIRRRHVIKAVSFLSHALAPVGVFVIEAELFVKSATGGQDLAVGEQTCT